MIKKIFIITLMIMSSVFMFNCDDADDAADVEVIVNKMADAINSKSYSDFKKCFHPDCDYNESFTESQFLDYASLGAYAYSGFDTTVEDDSATINADATITNSSGIELAKKASVFKMKKDGDNWKILKWTEEGAEMYRKPLL